MKLVIISGLSGAGKTIALQSLEDRGAYCIDNLPFTLLPAVIEQMRGFADEYDYIGLGVDARNLALQDLSSLPETLAHTGLDYEVVFLTASDSCLIRRYRETRRKHPFARADRDLSEAILHERQLLADLAALATLQVDTGHLSIYELRKLISLQVGFKTKNEIPLLLQSFGFKYGIPQDVDFVFDVRCLPNPYWQQNLRGLTGLDEAVVKYLQAQSRVKPLLAQLMQFLDKWVAEFEQEQRNYLSIAIGCTGGCHRSVFVVSQLAVHFRALQRELLVRHRELS